MDRRIIAPLLFGICGVAILLNLGAWQVRRLAWKTEIISRIEERISAPTERLPVAPNVATDQYRHVRVEGTIQPGELHVYTSAPPYGVGYRVIVPLETAEERRILLDRGFVPIDQKDAERHVGPITVEGALLWPQETDSFTSEPDLNENIWFARDVARMAAELETEPVMLVAEASDDPGQPLPQPVSVNLPNSHLEYAITWFSLALGWALMTVYLLWRIKRPTN